MTYVSKQMPVKFASFERSQELSISLLQIWIVRMSLKDSKVITMSFLSEKRKLGLS